MELVKPIYVPDFSSPQEKCEHKLAYVKKKMEAVRGLMVQCMAAFFNWCSPGH